MTIDKTCGLVDVWKQAIFYNLLDPLNSNRYTISEESLYFYFLLWEKVLTIWQAPSHHTGEVKLVRSILQMRL